MTKKNYYYVGVQTEDGLVMVTSVDNAKKAAEWDAKEKPKAFSKSVAESIAEGLCMNLIVAVVIQSLFELEHQFILDETKKD